MHPLLDQLTRRSFLRRSAGGLGAAALATLFDPQLLFGDGIATTAPHFAPKAKRVIYLCQSGAPSQIELFDPKPNLDKLRGTDLPASIRMGQRLTGMSSGQAAFPVANSMFKFAKHGKSGTEISELLPHISTVADEAGTDASLVASDKLHPSGEQYRRWVELIAPVVRSLFGPD